MDLRRRSTWSVALVAVCLASALPAQPKKDKGYTVSAVVHDPSGAMVVNARVEVRDNVSGKVWTASTSREGRVTFLLPALHRVDVTVSAPGFSELILHSVLPGETRATSLDARTMDLVLHIAPVHAEIEVGDPFSLASRAVSLAEQTGQRNTAEMVAAAPGVSLRSNGQLAPMPILHGFGDERVRVLVDGATTGNACPNHMNPPLFYAAPAQASRVEVMAGITPVSRGGDSLAGTIAVDSAAPVFAAPGERVREESSAAGFYRSNGQEYGGSVAYRLATRHAAIGYTGRWASNDDYADGSGHRVTSTYAQSTDHAVTVALQGRGNLLTASAGLHHAPYEGFVNAQMDLVRNYSTSLNLRWQRTLGAGAVDLRLFQQNTFHSMNLGRDKLTFPMPMDMPMNTHGRDFGYSMGYERPVHVSIFGVRPTLRIGNELHRFVLDDRWPPVAGTAPWMAPDAFVSIDNGRRVRLGSYVEAVSQWSPRWTTLLGLRNDTTWMNADPVQGYSSLYAADAAAFNAANRSHADAEIDATALVRFQPSAHSVFEFGYARKNRAPNLYERYAWSTNTMASGMIGWFGDGNSYVGDTSLKPEHANTLAGSASFASAQPGRWSVKLAPYATWLQDYIDVDSTMTTTMGMSSFAQLKFANHPARMVGGDLNGKVMLVDAKPERLSLSAVGAWVHGTRTDANTPLYQMMPVNLRLLLDEQWKGLAATAQLEAVDRKSRLDPNRFEQATPGYALFNLSAGYRHGRIDAGVKAENLFNRCYELPLGGVNFDEFMASMWMGPIKPLTGRGRSVGVHLTAHFH